LFHELPLPPFSPHFMISALVLCGRCRTKFPDHLYINK
jgi:hypothetical protein